MILICPACSTRYLVGAAAIGPAGRTVRCAKCSHTWHVDGVEEAQAAPAPTPEPAADAEPAPSEPPAAPPAGDEPPAAVETAEAAEGEPSPPEPEVRIEPLPQRLKPIPRGSGLPALPGEARRPLPIGWILLGLAVVGTIAGLALGRDAIVAAWPPANRLYASLGYPVEIPGMGLEFRNVVSTRTEEGGRQVLVVRGLIANITNGQRPIPGLRVALKDEQDRRVQEWSFKADAASVGPGESLPFETRIADPTDRARGLTIEFVAAP